MSLYEFAMRWITKIFDHFSQKACKSVVAHDPSSLWYFPDRPKTQEMRIKAAGAYPWQMKYMPDQYKTQEMCIRADEAYPWQLKYVPDQ